MQGGGLASIRRNKLTLIVPAIGAASRPAGGRYHITMPPQTLIDWPLM